LGRFSASLILNLDRDMEYIESTKTVYHVELEEAKQQLNLDDEFYDDDLLVSQLIEDATQEVENYIESHIAKTSNTLEVYDFLGNTVCIKKSPLISIDTISYLDSNGNSQSITVADCTIRKSNQKIEIELDNSYDTDKLTVVFQTGFTNQETCPSALKRFILRRVADLYDVERGSKISGAYKDDSGFWNALNAYKRVYF
jgi:uncharacterized phiE125 gp8 family phage protein